MMVDAADLVGITDIATALGVRPSAVVNWARRYPSFPVPVARVGGRPVYLRSQVVPWFLDYRGVPDALRANNWKDGPA